MPSYETTKAVDSIGKMHLEGNIIPSSWYQNITLKDKPDFAAITILSDIVYWYRPSEVRDEQTGQLLGYKKKFAADKLQRGYDQLAEQFGLSKEQARDACHRLRDAGLITIEIRHGVRYGQGMIANNVVYLEPVADAILAITYRPTQMGVTKQPSHPLNVDTNTETTTKITTNSLSQSDATPSEYDQTVETIEKEYFNTTGGTLSGTFYQKFKPIYDTNADHRAERLQYALQKMRDKRNFFSILDGYMQWKPPELKPQYPQKREQFTRPPVRSTLPIRTD